MSALSCLTDSFIEYLRKYNITIRIYDTFECVIWDINYCKKILTKIRYRNEKISFYNNNENQCRQLSQIIFIIFLYFLFVFRLTRKDKPIYIKDIKDKSYKQDKIIECFVCLDKESCILCERNENVYELIETEYDNDPHFHFKNLYDILIKKSCFSVVFLRQYMKNNGYEIYSQEILESSYVENLVLSFTDKKQIKNIQINFDTISDRLLINIHKMTEHISLIILHLVSVYHRKNIKINIHNEEHIEYFHNFLNAIDVFDLKNQRELVTDYKKIETYLELLWKSYQ